MADDSPVGTWQVQAPVAQAVCTGRVSTDEFNIIWVIMKMLIINIDSCHSC